MPSFCIVALVLFLMIVLLPGCAYKPIDKRAFITAIGIDESNTPGKELKIILKISLSKGDPKTTGGSFTLLTLDANSISTAISLLKSRTDKELVYGHIKAILIGENVAKKDIRPLLDFFMRNPSIHKASYLSVAKPTAYEVLQFNPPEEQVTGSFVSSLFTTTGSESPYIKEVTLFDAYRRVTEAGIDIAMPVIEANEKNLQVDKIALFNKKNIQMALTPEESQIFRLLTKGIHTGHIRLKTNDGTYDVDIANGKTKFKLKQGQEETLAVFRINLNGYISEKMEYQETLSEKILRELEMQAENKIQVDVKHLLQKIQKKELDPIGFGLRYRSRHLNPNKDELKWNDIYPQLEFQVAPECKIKGTEMID